MNIYEYLEGSKDCIDGKEAKENKSESYYLGYGQQYALEQNLTEASCQKQA